MIPMAYVWIRGGYCTPSVVRPSVRLEPRLGSLESNYKRYDCIASAFSTAMTAMLLSKCKAAAAGLLAYSLAVLLAWRALECAARLYGQVSCDFLSDSTWPHSMCWKSIRRLPNAGQTTLLRRGPPKSVWFPWKSGRRDFFNVPSSQQYLPHLQFAIGPKRDTCQVIWLLNFL